MMHKIPYPDGQMAKKRLDCTGWRGIYSRRSRTFPLLPHPEGRRPEDVHPQDLQRDAVPHRLHPPHTQSLHAGSPIQLGYGRLDPGAEPVPVAERRGPLPRPAPGHLHLLLVVGEPVATTHRLDRTVLPLRTSQTMLDGEYHFAVIPAGGVGARRGAPPTT